ncbi:MAG: hypothetical protein M1827_003611 [Pycnora praestabilis]|nr:MAG: hypothetical protein M1827_003611 [Pycnora praestabilis]
MELVRLSFLLFTITISTFAIADSDKDVEMANYDPHPELIGAVECGGRLPPTTAHDAQLGTDFVRVMGVDEDHKEPTRELCFVTRGPGWKRNFRMSTKKSASTWLEANYCDAGVKCERAAAYLQEIIDTCETDDGSVAGVARVNQSDIYGLEKRPCIPSMYVMIAHKQKLL